MGKGQRRLLLRIHCPVPASEVLQIGQSCLAVEEVVTEYAVEVVIHEERAIGQKKRRSRQHVVYRLQEFQKLSAQIPIVVNVTQPLLGFCRPGQFRHVLMRRPISS